MSEYTEQADKFLKDHGIRFSAVKIGYGLYFPEDKERRDIYRLRLVRKGKNSLLEKREKHPNGMYCYGRFTCFKFGASIADTEAGNAVVLRFRV